MKQIAYLLVFALITSCSVQSIEPDNTLEPENKPTEHAQIERARSIPLQTKSRAILAQNNAFAFDVFKAVSQGQKQPDNLFLSPFSLSAALGMLYNGADGNTKAEIAKVLGFSEYTPEEVNEYYKEVTKALLEIDPNTSLSLANAIWANKGVNLKKSFIELNQNYYDAEVSTLDFSLPATLKTINDWASEKTKGTIPKLLDKIDPSTIVMLANAIYFKSFWTHDFDKSKTLNKPFHNIDGTTSTVPLMHQKEMRMAYAQMDDCSLVELPYANTAYAMSLILPAEGQDLDALIASLDVESWQAMRSHRGAVDVTLSMPRFRVENSLENLAGVLSDLGMPEAFSSYANFSAMLDTKVSVTSVIQKSYISVDEDGTEAAAVTLIAMATSVLQPNPAKATMVLDRPFAFAITEQSTGAILFMGKITKL